MGEENLKTSPEETVETPKAAKKQPKMIGKMRQSYLVAAVIVVVLAVAGGGFWAWHNTPGFCDAICHTPQDPYNPTYYAEPGAPAVDKWGNEVKDASGMMAVVHRVDADANCLSCHEPTIKEQISEGILWISGDFYAPLSERSLDDLVRWHDGMDGTEFCLRPGCHDLTKTDLTAKTANLARNPHSWHHIEYDCSDCHKSHRASVMVCTECHFDAVAPQGWLTVEEAANLKTIYGAYALES